MSERRGNRIIRAAVVALLAGVLAGYAAPIASHDESAVEHIAKRTVHLFESACAIDWDIAPVAHAMFRIIQ